MRKTLQLVEACVQETGGKGKLFNCKLYQRIPYLGFETHVISKGEVTGCASQWFMNSDCRHCRVGNMPILVFMHCQKKRWQSYCIATTLKMIKLMSVCFHCFDRKTIYIFILYVWLDSSLKHFLTKKT